MYCIFLLNMSVATICVLEFGNFIHAIIHLIIFYLFKTCDLFPVVSVFVAISSFICTFLLLNMHFCTD